MTAEMQAAQIKITRRKCRKSEKMRRKGEKGRPELIERSGRRACNIAQRARRVMMQKHVSRKGPRARNCGRGCTFRSHRNLARPK